MEPLFQTDIQPVDLKFQRVLEVKKITLKLFETHLHYDLLFKAEEPIIEGDIESGWEESVTDTEIFSRREDVTTIDRYFIENPGVHCVMISVRGTRDEIKIYFKNRKDAVAMTKTLSDWMLKS